MKKLEMHKEIGKELAALYESKNHDYGDSFGRTFRDYGMIMVCVRLDDKMNRLRTITTENAMVADETIEDTLMDLANYAIMALIEKRMEKEPQ